ncbi:MAG: PAS domain S-box protein, partial [Chitinivibrionales bacterium]|nr:PAS domain S-box protein [Chitinivibrionales bacterium]
LAAAASPKDAAAESIAQKALLEKYAPAAVVINRGYEIIYYHGATARYLAQPGGAPSRNILDLTDEKLRSRLRRLISRVIHENKCSALRTRITDNGKIAHSVIIEVTPLARAIDQEDLYSVSFEEEKNGPRSIAVTAEAAGADEPVIRQLEGELAATKNELQSHIEQLKSLNEEMHSSNEELQAANEELETSREELQSLNEELVTVNTRLQDKIEEQETTNNDLSNFFSSTDIPTLFLDDDLRIKRFTPAMTQLVRFIAADIGRPFTEFTQENIGPELLADAREVLDKLTPVAREVACGERWFIRRALPYRTADKRIEGVVITFVDITERKRNEEEIRSLAKFPSENPNPIVRLSPACNVLYANDAAAPLLKMWGCAAGGTIPEPWCKQITETFTSGSAKIIEIECEGRIYSFESVPVSDAGYVNIYGRDITERKRAEEALRESEQRLRFHARNSPLAVVEWDADFVVVQWSKQAERLFGWSAAETLGKRIDALNIIYEADIPIVNNTMQRLSSGKEAVVVSSNRNCTKSGAVIECTWYNTALTDPEGKMAFTLSLVQDITERKQAENALRESEERFKAIAETAPVGIGVVSVPDAKFMYMNPAYLKEFGYEANELLGESTPQIYWSPEDRDRLLAVLKENGSVAEYEVKLKRKDGSPFWGLSSVRPITFNGSPALLGSFVDISDRKNAEEQILKNSEELQRKNKELERFNRAMVDREMRMVELKKQINELAAQCGQPPRFKLDF